MLLAWEMLAAFCDWSGHSSMADICLRLKKKKEKKSHKNIFIEVHIEV